VTLYKESLLAVFGNAQRNQKKIEAVKLQGYLLYTCLFEQRLFSALLFKIISTDLLGM